MGRHSNRLLTQIVDTPPPEVFMARLDGALSNLVVLCNVSLPMAGHLELADI